MVSPRESYYFAVQSCHSCLWWQEVTEYRCWIVENCDMGGAACDLWWIWQRKLIFSFATIQFFYFYTEICEYHFSTQKGWFAHYQVNAKLTISLKEDFVFELLNKKKHSVPCKFPSSLCPVFRLLYFIYKMKYRSIPRDPTCYFKNWSKY